MVPCPVVGRRVLLITTGSFTKDAQSEASRDGAPPVELIDGDQLCDLLKEYRLGVSVRQADPGGCGPSPRLLRRVPVVDRHALARSWVTWITRTSVLFVRPTVRHHGGSPVWVGESLRKERSPDDRNGR